MSLGGEGGRQAADVVEGEGGAVQTAGNAGTGFGGAAAAVGAEDVVEQGALAARRYGLKGIEEAIAAKVGLVGVVATQQIMSSPPDVVHLDHGLLGDFALNAEAPHVGLRRFEVGVDDGVGVGAERNRRA